jgi:hypothetical protein
VKGNEHSVYINGTQRLTYTSAANNTETNVGFAGDNTGSSWDSFSCIEANWDDPGSHPDIYDGSYGWVENGSLTTTLAGSATIGTVSNNLRVIPNDSSNNGYMTSNEFTRAAGMVFKDSWTISNGTASTSNHTTKYIFLTDTSANIVATLGWGNQTTGSGIEVQSRSYSPAGTEAHVFNTTGILSGAAKPINGTNYQFAMVLGGYDSAGVPDATGDYGHETFVHDGTNWNLIAAHPHLNTASMESVLRVSESGTETWHVDIHDVHLPDSSNTVEAVFTPTGYALDLFTDTSSTALGSHTADAGFDWSTATTWGAIDSITIEGNAARGGTGGGSYAISDVGMSEVVINANLAVSAGVSTALAGVLYRAIDANNYWHTFIIGEASGPTVDFYLRENDAGSITDRATVSVDPDTGTHAVKIRAEGTKIETWYEGGTSLTHTSALHQTETLAGIFSNHNSGNYGEINDVKIRPITSSDYNTALDAV